MMNADARVNGLLLPGEQVRRRTSPDKGAWWIGIGAPRVSVALLVAAFSIRSDQLVIAVLGSVFLVVVGVNVIITGLRLSATRYVLTDFRAIRVSGVLRNDCEWLTWGKVTDVSIARSMSDRVMKTATIQIHSANEDSAFRALDEVPSPLAFADAIAELVNDK